MAPNFRSKSKINASCSSQSIKPVLEDDDFQDCPSTASFTPSVTGSRPPSLKLRNSTTNHQSKKPEKRKSINPGKENCLFDETELDLVSGLDSIEPTLEILKPKGASDDSITCNLVDSEPLEPIEEEEELNSDSEFSEESSQLDLLLRLCASEDGQDIVKVRADSEGKTDVLVYCPLCGADITALSDDRRQIHTNECLDSVEVAGNNVDTGSNQCPGQVLDGSPGKSAANAVDVSPVVVWLRNLGLGKYEDIFLKQEIDWDALEWLTEEDLCSIGITTLGPRKKILNALIELRSEQMKVKETYASKSAADEAKPGANKLITDYFLAPPSVRKRIDIATNRQNGACRNQSNITNGSIQKKERIRTGKQKDVPLWCSIPGTQFRVDAFKYLRRDCSHWFLTHFHLDHYQGLTKSFSHGMIYCSSITAKLVNMKIGIPWDKIKVLPLNQKINIAGTDVTCFDANHCPGAVIILFEPPNGKPVLHTGDFRFYEEMTELSFLQACPVHTLILDTTYCNPQYDFPKQDAIIQFVIDAIQAEAFNPQTLFLIGSYTIGKERVFLEVARALHKKIYVTAAKLRILECLNLQQEDMQWFTLNEQESHVHVVPMWSIASFKRLNHISNQYMGRYSLIVAFSPTGWSFGKGKKSTGKRWQKGTIIRYEVPYSEHSSFTELKEFVKFISPVSIIPSVNNHDSDSQNSMISQLMA